MGRAYGSRQYRAAKRQLAGLPCMFCGVPSDSVQHVKHLARGGADTWNNYAPICLPCNLKDGGRLGGARSAANRRKRAAFQHARY